MKREDKNPVQELSAFELRWETEMGAWFPGQRVVFRGKNLFTELNRMRWMELLLYGITGRFFTEKQVRLFEGIWSLSTSYPEPRLWNNRVAALAGTARSTGNLGIAAALSASEAKIFGHQVNRETTEFLFRAKEVWESGESFDDFVIAEVRAKRRIGGFGRPIIRDDERIGPLKDLATELGFMGGPFVRMVFEIESILLKHRYRMHMNVSALTTALAADQGLSGREIYYYRSLIFSAGIVPCYIDAVDKPQGAFFPLRCSRIEYHGCDRRKW